jgi:hypothetical protein
MLLIVGCHVVFYHNAYICRCRRCSIGRSGAVVPVIAFKARVQVPDTPLAVDDSLVIFLGFPLLGCPQ